MKLAPEGTAPDSPLAIALSLTGDHAMLLVPDHRSGEVWRVHVKDHDTPPRWEKADLTTLRWVGPAWTPFEALTATLEVDLFVRQYIEGNARLPFGFHPNPSFSRAGVGRPPALVPGGSGVTCATFIASILEFAGLPLVDWDSYQAPTAERQAQDQKRQKHLASRFFDNPAQAALMKASIVPAIPRPEEVAAASGMSDRPVSLQRVEPEGAALLEELFAD